MRAMPRTGRPSRRRRSRWPGPRAQLRYEEGPVRGPLRVAVASALAGLAASRAPLARPGGLAAGGLTRRGLPLPRRGGLAAGGLTSRGLPLPRRGGLPAGGLSLGGASPLRSAPLLARAAAL